MSDQGVINLVYNYPLPGASSDELMRSFAAYIIANLRLAVRHFPLNGLPEHRERAACWLSAPGYEIEPDRVGFGVSGLQLLLSLLLGFTRTGDAIACDPVTYNGWLGLVRQAGRRSIAIPGDEYGMLPEALDAAASREPLWGVFLMPSLHNPCTTVMPTVRRKEIADVCRRRGLWVFDDDAYRFLNPDTGPSFAHLLPESTFWIQSLTKPLFPGIKTSLFVFPAQATEAVRETLHATGQSPSALTLPWVLDLLTTGALDRLLAEKREEACRRQKLAVEVLTGLDVRTMPTSFHLWVRLRDGWTSASADAALKKVGVSIVAGGNYAVDSKDSPAAIRIALAGEPDSGRLSEGLDRIAQVLRQKPERQRDQ